MENNAATAFEHLLPGMGPDVTALFVHAHPDDETIVTGATMAAAAAAGTRVVLVTCTRGELGEVIPPELAHLEVKAADIAAGAHDVGHTSSAPAADGTGLALERERELAAALDALGVREHIWLGQGLTAPSGGPVVFRDSGMQWGSDGRAAAASTVLPGSFSKAPLAETADLLATAIRALRPALVVTYAADGGYGHPDHVRTHELTMAALQAAATPSTEPSGWVVPAIYAIVSDRPERELPADVARLAVQGDLAAKKAAMQAHRTQITVQGERFALSDNVWRDITAVEEFVAVDPALIYGAQTP
ncbi:PIG-L family deacetylase [Arthrobacter glacialis]|uniref:PIG-L family deacetylase n=1 Tax=Arthrobacter glacialis TaxID=1664 RepID=UPI000CD3E3E1|nr:PIG-L family deacetylase [Arthrobacter glacialis]POH56952.1 1D-myo-inositol 2-acetamido-2-deoxy-alpha-D-glucopyranoside deacetylase [Arthrobacter glacialis]